MVTRNLYEVGNDSTMRKPFVVPVTAEILGVKPPEKCVPVVSTVAVCHSFGLIIEERTL